MPWKGTQPTLGIKEACKLKGSNLYQEYDNIIQEKLAPTIPILALTKTNAQNISFPNLSRWQFGLYQLA